MVDIVFFLLIYFLVTSLYALKPAIPMPPPEQAGSGSGGGAAAETESVRKVVQALDQMDELEEETLDLKRDLRNMDDELVILDITATLERRRALADTIRAVARVHGRPTPAGRPRRGREQQQKHG